MATLDVKTTAEPVKLEGASALPGLACEARDLKRVMAQLADQIAEAERRHADALKAMQERLGVMEGSTQEMRNRISREHSGALDRIEESMSELSGRMDPDAHRNPSSKRVRVAVSTAPVLRSALPVQPAQGAITGASSSGSSVVDHFDVVDSSPSHDDHQMLSADAADALARLYESSVSEPAGVPALDAVTAAEKQTPEPMPQPSFEPSAPAKFSSISSPAGDRAGHERAWLDGRIAEVASRLEQSLSGINPQRSMATIEERFTALETKLTEVISAPSRAPDLSVLASIEDQVGDLNAQLVAVQTHFSRLDTIELELRNLAERMSTDELTKVFQMGVQAHGADDSSAISASHLIEHQQRVEQTLQTIASQLSSDRIASLVAASRPAGPDASSIARLVAEEVAQRLPEPRIDHPDPSYRLEELKATLEAFVAERRHGDEQTNTMLDTMQQAMIRLLDRMDAFEQARYGSEEDNGEYAPGYQASAGHDDADQAVHHGAAPAAGVQYHGQQHGYDDHQEPLQRSEYRETEARQFDDHSHRSAPVVRGAVSSATAASQGSVPVAMPASETRPTNAPMSPSSLRASVQQVPADASQLEPALEEAASAPTRESFIAAARRAARKAADAPQEADVGPAPASVAPASRGGAAKKDGGLLGGKLSPVSMALICLILVGASFVAVKSTILAPSAPEAPAPRSQTQAPEAAPAGKRIQNLEDADGPAVRPGEPQRRSSIDGRAGDELTGQPANGGSLPQIQGMPTVNAALTREADLAPGGGRSNELPPLAIGPNSLRTAAAKGDPSAEFEVGARFAEGRGVQQDLQQAISWYQRSAAQGYAPAQYRLGSMFERGLGVKADLARARVWYQRAAEQGIVKAMHNLAVLTAGRDAALTDYTMASKWFQAAADHGLTDSQFNLAIMYDSGLGLEKDAKQAFKWFSLAARAGDEEAARRRDSLRQRLQPQDIATVEVDIAAWRPKATDQNVNDPRLAGEGWKKGAR